MIQFDKNIPIPDKPKRPPNPNSVKAILSAMEEGLKKGKSVSKLTNKIIKLCNHI